MKKLLLLLALSPFATSVLADKIDTAFYSDVILGQAKQGPNITGNEKVMDDEFSLGGRLGFQFHRNIALEAAYHDYGELKDVNSLPDPENEGQFNTIRDYFQATALNLGVKFIIHCSDCDLTLDLRWGGAMWDFKAQKLDSSKPGEIQHIKDDGFNRYYGFGSTYHVSKNVIIGLEYTITSIRLFDGFDALGEGLQARDFRISQIAFTVGARF